MNVLCFNAKCTGGNLQCKVTTPLPIPMPGDVVNIPDLVSVVLTVVEITQTKPDVYHIELEMKERNPLGNQYYFLANGIEGMT